MKIGLIIGRLGPGGAERQLFQLAVGLAQRGHCVEVVCYRGSSPMDRHLVERGVKVHNVPAKGRFGHVALTRRWMYDFTPDIVHAFMKRASCVAVLAGLSHRGCQVIASDYSTATYGRRKPSLWISLCLFGLAGRVVTETQMNRHSLERLAPWLKGKVSVIRNGLNLSRFRPPKFRKNTSRLHFCALGSVYEIKNPERVVKAVAHLYRRRGNVFHLDWYGRLGLEGDHAPSLACQRAMRLAESLRVEHLVTFHGDTSNVEEVLQKSGVFLHASLQEGFPNALVEAMAVGLPVLVSGVSDLPLVVEQAENGEVFDETDPLSIADAMERMLDLPESERQLRGERSRAVACQWFGEERFVEEHLDMYAQLMEVPHAP